MDDGGPSDQELLVFARSLLRDLGAAFADDELLIETITLNRELWVTLHDVSSRPW